MMDLAASLMTFFNYALVAVFAQNAIFTRALGVSRLVKLVDDDGVSSWVYCVLLTIVQLIASPMAYYANLKIAPLEYTAFVRPLVFVVCSIIAFVIVLVLVAVFMRNNGAREIISVLPMACFNCTVMGTLLVSTTLSYTLLQTMGFALGSSLGYVLAVAIVTEAQRKLQNRDVPAPLKGLPITLIYIGILSLALYGFTGHSPAI